MSEADLRWRFYLKFSIQYFAEFFNLENHGFPKKSYIRGRMG